MRRRPPLLWLLVSVGSLLVLVDRNRRPPPGVRWVMGLVAAFYLVCVVITSLAGPDYALAAAGAAVIPLTAAALVVATIRTASSKGGAPHPAIGPDDATPLGDTDQHSDAPA